MKVTHFILPSNPLQAEQCVENVRKMQKLNKAFSLLQIPHHFCNNSADSLLLFLTSPSLSRGRTLNSNLVSAAIAHAVSAESIRKKKTDQNTAPEGLISSCSVSFSSYTIYRRLRPLFDFKNDTQTPVIQTPE